MKRNRNCAIPKSFALIVASLILTLAAFAQEPAKYPDKTAAPAVSPAMPSSDMVLDRYVEAIGGRAAWEKLTSRQSIGTIQVPAMNLSGTVEVREKAPNRLLAAVVIAGATFRQGYDGTAAWADDPQNGLRSLTGAELTEAGREADFYRPLHLRKVYSKLAVTGDENIGDRDAVVMEATLPDGQVDKLYFDNQNGLLLRSTTHRHTIDGPVAIQADLGDYREVDGVKLPFSVRQSSATTDFSIQITEVHHNISLDDAQFSKPAAQ